VREKEGSRDVRNLGKPVELAARYFEEGADEVGHPMKEGSDMKQDA
jgi:imidazole glycerol phosphate synthase subunit HisF